MKIQGISTQTLRRLPYYLNYLVNCEADGGYISAAAVASALKLNEVQVRKDLATVCQVRGVPKKGFPVSDLIEGLRDCLGQNNVHDAILVGAGNLGRALLSYKGFEQYGLNIIAAFDIKEGEADGKKIFPLEKLPDIINRLSIKIAVITVPGDVAQQVCDILTSNGILAVWNFAPAHLTVPDGVLVQNENMASSLAVLSNHLKSRMEGSE
ncbi:MAG: redox-sensing transcriptional repressor Rex [Clostridia bacterium]|nr:redox-sensing transcriptional repressor Rex [Clostridia bacterium]